ncbi:unnamed protein product [Closterium sp. NIES-54]
MHFSCPFLDVGTGWVLDVGTGWVLDVGSVMFPSLLSLCFPLPLSLSLLPPRTPCKVLIPKPDERGQVVSGQAESEGGTLNGSPCLPSSCSFSPIPPPASLSSDEVVLGGTAAEGRRNSGSPDLISTCSLSPCSHPGYSLPSYPSPRSSPSPLSPPLTPSPAQNMVNVARMFLEGLQVKEEDSDLLFPLSPLPTPSPPVSLLLPPVAAPSPSPAQNMVNVTRWFLEDLKLKEEDSVVVKMDIEGHEWAILQHWLSNPRMAAIVDELFVEVHYHHPTMTEFTWTAPKFNHTRQDTTRLLTDLRKAGFYVHPWP